MVKIHTIECACCGDSHIIELWMDNQDNLHFLQKEQPFSLWQKISFWIKIRRERFEFSMGDKRDFFGLILNEEILNQLINVLEHYRYSEKSGLAYKPREKQTYFRHATTGKLQMRMINEVISNMKGIYLIYDEHKEINLNIHPLMGQKIGNYYKGEITTILNKMEVNVFLYYIKKIKEQAKYWS